MTSTPRARVVKAPYGRKTHLDYLNDGRTSTELRSTSCGRRATVQWTVHEPTPAAEALPHITCASCAHWAAWHARQEAADVAMAERYGPDWKDQPGNFLPAMDPAAAEERVAQFDAQQQAVAGRQAAHREPLAPFPASQPEQLAAAPSASCTSSTLQERGRRLRARTAQAATVTPPLHPSQPPGTLHA